MKSLFAHLKSYHWIKPADGTFVFLFAVLSPFGSTAFGYFAFSPNFDVISQTDPIFEIGADTFPVALLSGGWTVTGYSPLIGDIDTSFWYSPYGQAPASVGASLQALFTLPVNAPPQTYLDWVQVVTTSYDPEGIGYPGLDNRMHTNIGPLYDLTSKSIGVWNAQYSDAYGPLGKDKTFFLDAPARSEDQVKKAGGFISWSASLYPVLVNPSKNTLVVFSGIRWGFTLKEAKIGTIGAAFLEGAEQFIFGSGRTGIIFGNSSLNFIPAESFDGTGNSAIKLGSISFNNGDADVGGAFDGKIDFSLSFRNLPDSNFSYSTDLSVTNGLNGSKNISLAGLDQALNVPAGQSASIDIFAKIINLASPTVTTETYNTFADAGDSAFDSPVNRYFGLQLVELANPTDNGTIVNLNNTASAVPEPSSWSYFGMLAIFGALAKRQLKSHIRNRSRDTTPAAVAVITVHN